MGEPPGVDDQRVILEDLGRHPQKGFTPRRVLQHTHVALFWAVGQFDFHGVFEVLHKFDPAAGGLRALAQREPDRFPTFHDLKLHRGGKAQPVRPIILQQIVLHCKEGNDGKRPRGGREQPTATKGGLHGGIRGIGPSPGFGRVDGQGFSALGFQIHRGFLHLQEIARGNSMNMEAHGDVDPCGSGVVRMGAREKDAIEFDL
jgi:hypothetical protein